MQPTLYLMLGYPGAGKTTTAHTIHLLTGAEHLWADHIRRELFETPTYDKDETAQLYHELNERTAALLRAGKSVVFDTSFNFHKDREHLRGIAAHAGAQTVLLWVKTPKEIAEHRATLHADTQSTRPLGNMQPEDFHRLSDSLEPPKTDEPYIVVDGTKVTEEYIAELLKH